MISDTASGWYGSDRLVDRLATLRIEHVALNPGASIRGLHDSLVNPPGRSPDLLLALHEEIAVAIAHGYAKASGRPMAVGLHDTVGLLHSSMAIFNAFVDRAPMLLLVGTGPLDAEARRPWLDWIHTAGEQGEFVRHLTRWNEQPTSLEALLTATVRAWRAARTAPGGPALIGVDIELQERAAAPPAPGQAFRMEVPRIGPDPVLIRDLARDIRAASRPLFITDRPLSMDGSRVLVRLAERVGAGLVELGGGASFPVGHPHDISESVVEAIAAADHLTFIEVRDPGWALGTVNLTTRRMEGLERLPASASIGLSGLMSRSWIVTESSGPERLEIIADAHLALAHLDDELANVRRPLDSAFAALAARPPVPLPAQSISARGLHRGHVGRVVADALDGTDWILAHGDFRGWARRSLRFQRTDQHLGRSGGEGLGCGPGATLGAALALRGSGKVVLSLQGDGDLLYTPQALWTAASAALPALMVVDANRTYGKDELHQRVLARERGRPEDRVHHGIAIDTPAIEIADLARSLGVAAEGPVHDLDGLRAAMARAVQRVRAGEPAVVEVRTAPG
jgi:thiamine pyrophosphate-dependent acetolactate synthase large subunit-like protein